MTGYTVETGSPPHTRVMIKSIRLASSTLVVGLLLAGCSGSSTPATAPATAPQTAATTHVKTPWDSLLKDEAKAKNVQKIVNDAAKRQQQAIEKQTHP